MIYLAEDPDNRVFYPEEGVTALKDLQKRLDRLASSRVAAYIVDINAALANYPSKVIESYLEIPESSPEFGRRAANFRLLFQTGIDHNAYLLDGSRKLGIAPWIGIRMNDIHYGHDLAHPLHSQFWREHPEYWCAAVERPCENTLDYSHREVRERMLYFIQEAAEKYDADGFFLDWMRWPSIVPFGKGPERAPLLTEFMTEVRLRLDAAGKARRHHIGLAARVPLDCANALRLGLDAVNWCRKDLLDALFIGNFGCGLESDAPVEEWHREIGDKQFPVIVSIEQWFFAEPPCKRMAWTTPEEARGVAAAAYWRGAAGVHLFNFMDSLYLDEHLDIIRLVLNDLASPDALRGKNRRHRLSWNDSKVRLSDLDQIARLPEYAEKWLAERKKNGDFPAPLPKELALREKAVFHICTAWRPKNEAYAVCFIKVETGGNNIAGTVNGHPFKFIQCGDNDYEAPVPNDWIKDGWTALEVAADERPLRLREVAIDFRY